MSSLNIAQQEEENDEQDEQDENEKRTPPTAGDLLKLEYVKHKVVPTCIVKYSILFFFFFLS